MPTQIALHRKYSNSRKDLIIHETEVPSPEARFAIELIGRWGTIAAVPDGEDSAGRARLALMPTNEVVGRACDIAGAAFAKFRELGWLTQAPDISEIVGTPDEDDK